MTRRITSLTTSLARFGRRVADVLAECNYAQRRATMLMMNPDAYLIDRDKAPDDYAEFLFRTSGAMLREPTAAASSSARH